MLLQTERTGEKSLKYKLFLLLSILLKQNGVADTRNQHGDRTPLKTYPTDPYGQETIWPNGFAQLTNRGKAQQYELGKWLRNRYKGFLPDKYSVNDIYVVSTDKDRTIMSAQTNLAGLYPPVGTDVWNTNVTWQPVPVHIVKTFKEAVTTEPLTCQRYLEEIKNLNEDNDIKRVKEEMQPVLEYVTNNIGVSNIDLSFLVSIYDILFVQNLYNFKLPDWTKRIFPFPLKKYYDWGFSLDARTHQLKRLRTGILINEIINRFINKTRDELIPNRKMWMYSAHDSNIANLLNTLDNFDPPYSLNYASAILIELLQHNGSYFVSTIWKNDTNFGQLSVRGCDVLCPLNNFATLLKPYALTPEEWEMECELPPMFTD